MLASQSRRLLSLSTAQSSQRFLRQSFVTHGRGKSSRTRNLHSSPSVWHGHLTRPEPGTGIKVHFEDAKGVLVKTVEANEGDDLLSIAHEHDIDLEGACEGSVACSTCHVILPPEYYDLLPEPDDDENDMLDMAFALTDTSRLGCQVKLTRELDGMTARLPSATRNMFVDGKKSSH
ncbi:ferredoxin [Mycena crocata]|nr:ferredoxin [Mycena crocata]